MIAGDGDCAADGDRSVGESIVVECVGKLVPSVWNGGNCAAQNTLRVVLCSGSVASKCLVAVTRHHMQQALLADAVCGDLCGEVAFALVGRADIRQDERQNLAVECPAFYQ